MAGCENANRWEHVNETHGQIDIPSVTELNHALTGQNLTSAAHVPLAGPTPLATACW